MTNPSPLPLSRNDRSTFEEYLAREPHELSSYHFSNIYLWKPLFDISWMVQGECLCVFFRDRLGSFLYLSPTGGALDEQILSRCFSIMDRHNSHAHVSRIENIEQSAVTLYEKMGYAVSEKPCEYLYLRDSLCGLKGNTFKSKRSAYNSFCAVHTPRIIPLSPEMKGECLALYDTWMRERETAHKDPLYRQLLEDSRLWQGFAFDNFALLRVRGIAVRVGSDVRAYTFGFAQNPTTFCILAEICDLSFRGIAQFVFREFCRTLEGFVYINAMDDSALLNLGRVKESYRPCRKVGAHVAIRGSR
jgi:uncharacterized protein